LYRTQEQQTDNEKDSSAFSWWWKVVC